MPAGLTAALLMLAPAANYGPAPPPPAKKVPAAPQPSCDPSRPRPDSNEIVVCALRVDGYRLDPDVMEARKALRSGGRPTRPGPSTAAPSDCATVGPMGCRFGPALNVVAAAITAATMAEKALKGENVGQMFVTDPHPSEYQLYLAAKARREAAAAAAKAKASAPAGAQPVQYPAEPAGH